MTESLKKKLEKFSEIYFTVKASPNAAKTALKEVLADETIKIDVAAKPEKGKANAELIKFLAKEFKVDKGGIKIISGAGERVKLIKIKV